MARWQWVFRQITKRLWFRASLFSLLGVVTALLALLFKHYIPAELSSVIGADAVDKILGIIASSMLAVTTFSLSTMVAAYGAASSNVTPRATTLVMEDATTQNALATFIGSFLFSLVGLIALSTGAYGGQGRVLMFAVTLLVIALVIYTLLRWIDHLSKLGRVGETIDRVEKAALDAIRERQTWPHLGGAPYPPQGAPPEATRIGAATIGYVQHVDIRALGEVSREANLDVYVEAIPGTFLSIGQSIIAVHARKGAAIDATLQTRIRNAFTIGVRRSFENDPRFGVAVLAEIGSRALSQAFNDSGTVIDVIGRGVRTLDCWARHQDQPVCTHEGCGQVFVPPIKVADLFEDFFMPIARDGAGLVEVGIRLQKALASLRQMHPDLYAEASWHQSRMALKYAETALALEEEKEQLRQLVLLR